MQTQVHNRLDPDLQLRYYEFMADAPLVRRSPVAAKRCNLARGFELIGDRWTLLILRSALWGVRRFDDFQADLDIPRSVLSNRLAGLVESGIMERHDYRDEGQRARVEYHLTKMGQGLSLPFIAMTQWGDRWLADGRPPLTLRSKITGQKLRVALIDEGGRVAKRLDVELIIDPAARRYRGSRK
jgi:DNA-binding HxlR family transcriptional regulator